MLTIINNFNNPLDQFVVNIFIKIQTLGYNNFILSNIGLYLILTLIVLISIFLTNNNINRLNSNRSNIILESIYLTIYNMVINQINEYKGLVFFPFIITLFIFILSNNLVGMIPYTFSCTSFFVITFFMSFSVVVGATVLGLYLHVFKFFSILVPENSPLSLLILLVSIEFISYIARNVSLGLRLAANVLSGHMLLNILSDFIYNLMNSKLIMYLVLSLPLGFVTAFYGLELGIAFIQAQVFAVLSSSYIRDGFNLH